MRKPTIHFVFTVPLGANIFRRIVDKVIKILKITPLHRFGIDFLIPWQRPIRSVHAISYNLLHAFKQKGYKVRLYSLYEHTVANMNPGDIFIGLPLPAGGMGATRSNDDDRQSVTSRTIREFPNNKNFIIMPYSHDETYANWTKSLVRDNAKQGGGAIFIGGPIWERDWSKSPYRDIDLNKKTHVIMGIDPNDYPRVKIQFNPKGKRRFLYIGHTAWYKNTVELERIASRIPNFEGLHIGEGEVKGWKNMRFASLTPAFMSKIAEEYDFFLSVSTADPQATTILEQMCFGFVIASTPETGYEYSSLIKLSTNNTEQNIQILNELQQKDESELLEIAKENRKIAEDNQTWSQFCTKIINFVDL